MKNVAVVGIQGVPAQYGGFESLVENLIGDHKIHGERKMGAVLFHRTDAQRNHAVLHFGIFTPGHFDHFFESHIKHSFSQDYCSFLWRN